MKNQVVTILTIKGNHSRETRENLLAGLQARGAAAEIITGRHGFETLVVNGQRVARIFASDADMVAWEAKWI